MTGGGFHEESDSSGDFLEKLSGLFGNHFESDFFALLHVSAHVTDDEWDFEGGAASELAGEGFARLGGFFRFGGTEVDEVAIVADYGLGIDLASGDRSLKFFGGVIGKRFGVPLLGGGCEDLDGSAADGLPATDGIGESFSGGHVGADEGCGHGMSVSFLT